VIIYVVPGDDKHSGRLLAQPEFFHRETKRARKLTSIRTCRSKELGILDREKAAGEFIQQDVHTAQLFST
jgi:hypothetical protein